MRDLIILFVHVITTVLRVGGLGGVRTVIAESVLTKPEPAHSGSPNRWLLLALDCERR
jgi:hypothetical protein